MAKVERKQITPPFIPVTITLVSQAEVDYFTVILGQGKHSIAAACGLDGTGDLYDQVRQYASTKRPELTGTINVKA